MADNQLDQSIERNISVEEKDYVWSGTIFPLSLAIVVGNSIALAIFLKKSFLVKKSNYLLVNLTIADLLVGISGIIFAITNVTFIYFSTNFAKLEVFKILAAVCMCNVSTSIFTLSVISVERVLAVVWPFHHRLAKRWHYLTAIGTVWLLSLITTTMYTLEFKKFGLGEVGYAAVTYLFMVISLVTIFVSYFSIWIKMTFFTKFRHCRTVHENNKLAKTLLILTLVSLGTWLPKIIADIVIITYKLPQTELTSSLYMIMFTLLFCNSLLNLVIYTFRMPEFRRELKNMFCQCFKI
jgi:hypothetical protein